MQWPLARVNKVHSEADGITRTVTIKTATNTLDRGVKRLVPLPCQPDIERSEVPRRAKEVEKIDA
jgi:hypothetical protein